MTHNGVASTSEQHPTQHLTHQPKYYNNASPLPRINPTHAHFRPDAIPIKHSRSPSSDGRAGSPQPTQSKTASHAITYKWTSRNNRKGRHAIAINPNRIPAETQHLTPRPTTSPRKITSGIWRMFTVFPVWDISYDVAAIFTLGSVIWVINAFFVWLPLVRPNTEFKNEELYGGGITAFIGATVFEMGSFLLMAEAVNESRTGCFGWALERAFSHESEKGSEALLRLRPSKSHCTHHHSNMRNLLGTDGDKAAIFAPPGSKPALSAKSWIWFPSSHDLRTHYIHELGFLASFAQLLGASIFWIAGLTALPGIYTTMSRPITIIFYWTPQVLGGLGFIVSGTLFMLETQTRWYKPAFKTLGWWIGAWNLVGGVGFTVCPAFGYDEKSWAQYQAGLSTFWGSWAFLVGSVVQLYESLEKFPVEVDKGPGDRDA